MKKYGSLIVLLAWAGATPADTLVAEFRRENAAAMERMMAAMHSPSSGDIDRDFVSMMTPHHMGAIEMAQLELRYGHNEQLRRIAQEIIITQRQEIDAMSLAIKDGTTAPRGGVR
jgi:uncharacterized protein (DUF305 family)